MTIKNYNYFKPKKFILKMERKLVKTIVIDGEDYQLNIFVEKRNSVRASFTNHGINIRIPRHLSIEEQNKAGKEMLDWAVFKIKSEPEKYKERIYNHGNELFVFGKRYLINIDYRLSSKNFTKVSGENIFFSMANHHDEDSRQGYMRRQVRKIIAKRHLEDIISFVHEINNSYFNKSLGKISIKHTTSRWGQCHTNTGDIDLSTRILLAPIPVIRYVIIHELAHLVHANHSKRFWSLVESVDPNYKNRVKWLNKFGHTLNL